MQRYFLKINAPRDAFNAEGKAPADVEEILRQSGYAPLEINVPKWDDPFGLCAEWCYRPLKGKLKSVDELFIQYPFYAPHSQRIIRSILQAKISVTILIHDLDMLRGGREESEPLLRQAGRLIVHTEAMKNFLCEREFDERKIKVLQCFDYLVKHRHTPRALLEGEDRLVFAGNLEKSDFLKRLSEDKMLSSLLILLYGATLPSHVTNEHILYKGCFQPNDLRNFEGEWGLVWDGESLTTCCGSHGLGEYLRYNASHKLSLYLAAEMPVIVWCESGVAPFVEKNHLGITIHSLTEIPQRIKLLSDRERELIKKAVAQMGERIRQGEMLRHCLP